MNRVLIRQYVSQSALLWLACAVTLFAFAWVRVWVVSLLDMTQFQTVLDQFREFERFAPIEFDALLTYAGRVGMTFDEPVVIFCVVVWSIARGSDVVAGSLGRGTLEMILTQPVRRVTLLASHAAVSAAGLAGLCLSVWAGIAVGVMNTVVEETVERPQITVPVFGWRVPLGQTPPPVEVPLSDRIDPSWYAAGVLQLFAFGFFILGVASAVSVFERYRWRAVGLVVAGYVLQLVVFGLGKASPQLAWMLNWSFFSAYKPQKYTAAIQREGPGFVWSWTRPLDEGLLPPMIYPAMLIAGGAIAYAVAIAHLRRRDLPAPL